MNDLKEACSRFFPILYADDTGLVSSLCPIRHDYMIFHHRQRKIDEFIPDIRINDSPIERVTDFNF